MKYRKATFQDLKEILIMKTDVKQRIKDEQLPIWLDGYPSDDLIQSDIENGFGRVVEDEEMLVGYACFHKDIEEYPIKTFLKDHLMSFGRVMVKTGFTGKHYGAYLIESMIKEAKSLGANGIGILVDSCNKRALCLYQKYGFTKEGSKQFPFAFLDVYSLYFGNRNI